MSLDSILIGLISVLKVIVLVLVLPSVKLMKYTPATACQSHTTPTTKFLVRSFVRFISGANLPPALRPRTGPMRNPSNTGACTVYFKSPAKPAGFSGKVLMVRPCPTSRAAGTCHLLSTPSLAALTTPRCSQFCCDGLSQFKKRTQVNPLVPAREFNLIACRNLTRHAGSMSRTHAAELAGQARTAAQPAY